MTAAPPRFLRLEVHFLTGTYGGAEWPPSPARLVQALAAGAGSTSEPGLDWFERQPPPLILAGDEPPGVWRRDYVPLNATPGHGARQARDRLIRRGVEPVAYLWRLRESRDEAAVEPLAALAARLTGLGSGQDMAFARAEVVGEAPVSAGARRLWLPRPPALPGRDHDRLLEVPAPGLMRELARRHAITAAGERVLALHGHWSPQGGRSTADGSGFATMAYSPSDAQPRTALVACRLEDLDGAALSWRAGEAVRVAGMVRHALIACAGGDADLAAFAAGHVADDPARRVAVVPVPSTGHAHADGRLRRVLLTARPQDADTLARLLLAMPPQGLPLVDEDGGAWAGRAVPVVDARAEPVLGTWLRPWRRWASVQPVILPGLDSGQARRTRKLILRALAHAGLDTGLVEQVEFGPQGYLPQSIDYRDLRIKAREGWRMPAVHVRLTFARPVIGPLVLGQGRNAGVGTLAPCADPE